MIDVFISYKRDDRDDARAIAEILAADGYEVWWDILLLPGDRFRDEIAAVIEKAKAVVVLWSKEALKSDFVIDEATLANRLSKYLPVSLDGSTPPLGLQNVHCPLLIQWRSTRAPSDLDSLRAAVRFRTGDPVGKTSFVAQNLNQTMEAGVWKTVAEMQDAAPAKRAESLDLYLEKFGPDGLFSALARRWKADPSSRRRYQQADAPTIDEWKRPVNTGRVLSGKDMASIKIHRPADVTATDATFSPDENGIIVSCYEWERKGWFDRKFTGYLREYRLRDGSHVRSFGTCDGIIRKISLAPDGKRLALVQGGGCSIMDLATGATTPVVAHFGFQVDGPTEITVHWTADSKRCLFTNFDYSKRRARVLEQVLLKPDGSIKKIEDYNPLHECANRDSWLVVARDAIAQIDRDLDGHPSEVFVLDRTHGTDADTRIAVSPSGAYVAIAQRLGVSKALRLSVYDSKDWSRLGSWEVVD